MVSLYLSRLYSERDYVKVDGIYCRERERKREMCIPLPRSNVKQHSPIEKVSLILYTSYSCIVSKVNLHEYATSFSNTTLSQRIYCTVLYDTCL